jgi:hypothetical protein
MLSGTLNRDCRSLRRRATTSASSRTRADLGKGQTELACRFDRYLASQTLPPASPAKAFGQGAGRFDIAASSARSRGPISRSASEGRKLIERHWLNAEKWSTAVVIVPSEIPS